MNNILDWIEPDLGVVSNIKNPPENSSDNGLLMTAEYLIWETTISRNKNFSWFHINLAKRQIRPGLYNRQINQTNNVEAQDDVAADVICSYVLNGFSEGHDQSTNQLIYKELKNNFWFYNTAYPELNSKWKMLFKAIFGHDVRRSWLYRFPGFAAAIKACNGKWLNPLDYLMVYIAYKGNYTQEKKETSGRKLLYLYSLALKGRSKMIDKIINSWENKMVEMYGPKWLNELYRIWYPEGHPMRECYK